MPLLQGRFQDCLRRVLSHRQSVFTDPISRSHPEAGTANNIYIYRPWFICESNLAPRIDAQGDPKQGRSRSTVSLPPSCKPRPGCLRRGCRRSSRGPHSTVDARSSLNRGTIRSFCASPAPRNGISWMFLPHVWHGRVSYTHFEFIQRRNKLS
eukprot:scaffold5858_cov239-Pinguiococcus_pyrenoidosus.AAC.1